MKQTAVMRMLSVTIPGDLTSASVKNNYYEIPFSFLDQLKTKLNFQFSLFFRPLG